MRDGKPILPAPQRRIPYAIINGTSIKIEFFIAQECIKAFESYNGSVDLLTCSIDFFEQRREWRLHRYTYRKGNENLWASTLKKLVEMMLTWEV